MPLLITAAGAALLLWCRRIYVRRGGYYGDSVLNSMSDILACMLGFLLARRLRWWWTTAWVVAAEVVMAMVIRDNLTLNIIMLIWPIEAIKRWQTGA